MPPAARPGGLAPLAGKRSPVACNIAFTAGRGVSLDPGRVANRRVAAVLQHSVPVMCRFAGLSVQHRYALQRGCGRGVANPAAFGGGRRGRRGEGRALPRGLAAGPDRARAVLRARSRRARAGSCRASARCGSRRGGRARGWRAVPRCCLCRAGLLGPRHSPLRAPRGTTLPGLRGRAHGGGVPAPGSGECPSRDRQAWVMRKAGPMVAPGLPV